MGLFLYSILFLTVADMVILYLNSFFISLKKFSFFYFMSAIITIPFQQKNITATISNAVIVGLGILLIYFGLVKDQRLFFLGTVIFVWGLYSFSRSKGVLVNPNGPLVWSYQSYFWIKAKSNISLKDIESVMVTTGTQTKGGYNGFFLSYSTSFMVYKLYLLPSTYSKREKVFLGDFFTKEECMLAAEELSKTSGLPLVFKIRK
jgi:hypothetical protein